MQSADVIVVGSGPSGTFAAYQLRGRDVLVLDVGNRGDPNNARGQSVRSSARLHPITRNFSLTDWPRFESLHNVFHAYISPKLKGPLMRFVTLDANRLESRLFGADRPCRQPGGRGNGKRVGRRHISVQRVRFCRLPDFDLTICCRIRPVRRKSESAEWTTICLDSLARRHGLQPPVELPVDRPYNAETIRKATRGVESQGLFIGRPRLAVLSHDHDGRPPIGTRRWSFFARINPVVYNPAYTLDEMTARSANRSQTAYSSNVFGKRMKASRCKRATAEPGSRCYSDAGG